MKNFEFPAVLIINPFLEDSGCNSCIILLLVFFTISIKSSRFFSSFSYLSLHKT